jgi:hypothetical protein
MWLMLCHLWHVVAHVESVVDLMEDIMAHGGDVVALMGNVVTHAEDVVVLIRIVWFLWRMWWLS